MTNATPGTGPVFERLAVDVAGYASPERAIFRCRETFRGVDLAGKTLLEIGAGVGVFSAYAVTQGAKHVVALEPEAAGSTEGSLAKIRRMRAELGVGNFDVVAQTIQGYEPGGRTFDAVLFYNSVNHLDEPMCMALGHSEEAREVYRRLFRKIAAMMNPGAWLVLLDCSRHNFFPMLGLPCPFARNVEWKKHQSPRTWTRLLEPLGFTRDTLSWYRPYPLRRLGVVAANSLVSFLLSSHFRLVMRYQGTPRG